MYVETQHQDPEAPLNMTFSFKSDRAFGTLFQHNADGLLLSVELMNGHLCLRSWRGQGSNTVVQQLPEYLSNKRWHRVEASLGGVFSFIRLLCTEESCSSSRAEVQLLHQASELPEPGAARHNLFIGAFGGNWGLNSAADEGAHPPAFLGCFKDVFVDSQLVVPVILQGDSDAQANVTMGCSDKNKCDDHPCQNRGRCVTQGWRSYMCECHRPYAGNNCEEGKAYTHSKHHSHIRFKDSKLTLLYLFV